MMSFNDPLKVWDGQRFVFTLKKLCKIIFGDNQYSLPAKFHDIADKPIKRVMADNMVEKNGIRVVFDLSWNVDEIQSKGKIQKYIENGIIVVTNRIYKDKAGKKLDVIDVVDPYEAWVALGRYVKNVIPMPTIGITGSAGKTTSTMLAKCVFDEKYNTFISGENGRNYNTVLQVVNQWILRANNDYTFHVQECGGETPKLIEYTANVINADAFGITNIDTSQHIATYKTSENLISDKTSFDRVRKENTFGVINIDDDVLKNFNFKSPVITFAINNKDADYVAENIEQRGEYLEFDIVDKNAESTHIKINIIGKHNVYNALMVYAFAKKFGFTDEEIQNGFLKYKSVGIRQNLRLIAGRYIYMDSYNASVESTLLTLKTLNELNIPIKGRKIAIVGERRTLDENTYQINYNLGEKLAGYENIDEIIVVGEKEAKYTAVYDGVRNTIDKEKSLSYYDSIPELANKIKYQTKPGDAILIKGRYQLKLWGISDMAFGTDYSNSEALVPLGFKRQKIITKNLKGEYSQFWGGVNLLYGQDGFDNTKLVLPNAMNNKFIVRIGDNSFQNKSQLKMIVFGTRVHSIGNEAFNGCKNLDYIELPKKCFYLGERSFENCCNMVRASLLGVGHISEEAFKNCINLQQVVLSEKCATIENGAFDGCNKLTILAPKNSYAESYAISNGINFREINSEEELEKLAKNGTRLHANIYGLEKHENACLNSNLNNDEITILFAGDIMAHDTQLEWCFNEKNGLYEFDKLFVNTEKYIHGADIAVANLETTFGPRRYSGFPRFNTPTSMADALRNAGFDIIAVANNHMYDTNYAGVVQTKKVLEEKGLKVTGSGGKDTDVSYAIANTKGVKIAVLNYTYRTQSVNDKATLNNRILDDNTIRSVNTFCFESLDRDLNAIYESVEEVRNLGADVVLLYYHWGCEYERFANVIQKYIAYKTAEMGVDAIIGSHPHVLQEMENIEVSVDGKFKRVPVFYSLGNYCWGGRFPRTQRETVHNGALAKLIIKFDREKNLVEEISTDYIPLYIKTDYIYNKYDFNVLSLNDMTAEEIKAFNLNNSESVDDIKEEIRKTLNGEIHKVPSEMIFDQIIEVQVGEKIDLKKTILSGVDFACIKSENAPVASVLQSGIVVGNSRGFVGLIVEMRDGRELYYIVKVTGVGEGKYPVIVDEYNSVPDIYRPYNMQSGTKYVLRNAMVTKPTAEAWNLMRLSSIDAGINIQCISGYRTNEGQLKNIINYAEKNGWGEAEKKYMPLGHTEHHLGTVIDVKYAPSRKYTRETVFKWIMENCHKFGFIFRKPSEEDMNEITHLHLRFINDVDAAEYINNMGISINEYVESYEKHQEEIKERNLWKYEYLEKSERKLPMEEWSELTLKRICELIGIKVPLEYKSIQDRIVPRITLTNIGMKPGSIFFYDKMLAKEKTRCRKALREGATLAITENVVNDENGRPLPQIVVEDAFDACANVGKFLREKCEARVICIEEKGREHILRDMLYDALSSNFKVHINKKKTDNRINIIDTIQDLTTEHDYYIQNMFGAYSEYIKKNACMLCPNISILLSIDRDYPEFYSNKEDYLKDKLSIVDITLKNNGVVLINIDDENLKQYENCKNVITFSQSNKNADYFIKKVRKRKGQLRLFITNEGNIDAIVVDKKYQQKLDYILARYVVENIIENHNREATVK